MTGLKKLLVITLIISNLVVLTIPAQAAFDIAAESAILMEAKTGKILFSKNANQELPPASMTKIMTMLLAMEAVDEGQIDLEDRVVASRLASSMGGSQIYLAHREQMQMKTLLEAVAIASANDACVAIGEAVGGTEDSFVGMMNQKAKQLGLQHTNFVNSTGLPTSDGEHYSSAHDIAVMSRELITNHPRILEWTDIKIDKIRDGKFTLYNTNQLLKHYPAVDGLKTGWTDEAGYCLAATAKKEGMRLISVVMKTDSEEERIEQSARLLNYGFSRFDLEKVVAKGAKVGTIAVNGGQELEVPVKAAQDLEIVHEEIKGDLERDVRLDNSVTAPVEKGTVVGELIISQNSDRLGSVDLVTAQQVEQAGILTRLLRWVKGLVTGFFK
ncbi:MAG: D-alanyl-D-alanine carboxypeptidase family protein [Bacillota bacterium]